MNQESISFEEALPTLISLLEKVGDKRVGEAQIAVFRSAWERIEYADMSSETTYSTGYLHRTVAPLVFKQLSEALGEKVHKRSLRGKVERILAVKKAGCDQQGIRIERKVIGQPPLLRSFVGRSEELQMVDQSQSTKRCILICGAPGVGKTDFMAKMFNQAKNDPLSQYEIFVWKYVTSNSPSEEITELRQLLGIKEDRTLESFAMEHRLFLCLDGMEKWLHSNSKETESFLQKFILTEHQSRIVLTSREPVRLLNNLMRLGRPVTSLKLEGLKLEDTEKIFKNYGLSGSYLNTLTNLYSGNPYLLHILCERIKSNGGNAEPFLKCKTSLAREAMMPSLDQLFVDNPELNEVERFLLTYLSHTSSVTTFSISSISEKISSVYSFEYSKIVQAIEKLRAYSLIEQLDDTEENEVPAYLKRYVKRNPLNIFPPESLLPTMAG
jgi:hypothetical protein